MIKSKHYFRFKKLLPALRGKRAAFFFKQKQRKKQHIFSGFTTRGLNFASIFSYTPRPFRFLSEPRTALIFYFAFRKRSMLYRKFQAKKRGSLPSAFVRLLIKKKKKYTAALVPLLKKEKLIVNMYRKLLPAHRANRGQKFLFRDIPSLRWTSKYYQEESGIFAKFKANRYKHYFKKVVFNSYKYLRWNRVLRFRWRFFKKLLKKWIKRFRRIQKNKLFVNIFKAMFWRMTGLRSQELMQAWRSSRSVFLYSAGHQPAAALFSRSIFLRPQLLVVLLGLAPNKRAGRMYSLSGIITINGLVGNSLLRGLRPGDICQVSPQLWKKAGHFQSYYRWDFIKTSIQNFKFIQVDWSIFAIYMVRWPASFEISAPKFLTERWVRYYIRNFPPVRRLKKTKSAWKYYNVSFG